MNKITTLLITTALGVVVNEGAASAAQVTGVAGCIVRTESVIAETKTLANGNGDSALQGQDTYCDDIGHGITNPSVKRTSSNLVKGNFVTADEVNQALSSLSSSGLSTVTTDNTLVGDGTVNNPLGVNPNIINQINNVTNRVTNNTTNIQNLMDGKVGLVQQHDPNGKVTVAAASGGKIIDVTGTQGVRQITGIADGAVNSTSRDAINGSQLFAVVSHATNTGNSIANNLGGGSRYDPETGSISAPTYNIQSNEYHDVGSALGALDHAIANQSNKVDALGNWTRRNITRLNAGVAGATALAALEFDRTPGKLSIASGMGYYAGQSSFAGGLGYSFNDRVRVNGRGWYSPGGRTGGGALGASFTVN